MKLLPNFVAAAATCAVLASPVQAACWNQSTFEAAQVRELETMLTVGAMRCMQGSASFAAEYNAFERNNADALKGAGDTLQRHFAAEYGETGTEAFRGFVSAEADHYVSGAPRIGCEDLATIARMASQAGSLTALVRFATAADIRPSAENMLCREAGPTLLVASRR